MKLYSFSYRTKFNILKQDLDVQTSIIVYNNVIIIIYELLTHRFSWSWWRCAPSECSLEFIISL